MAKDRATKYRFSFGPWNISTGEDPFVKPREPLAVMRLIERCRKESGKILVSTAV